MSINYMKKNQNITTQELALAIEELAQSTAEGFLDNQKNFQILKAGQDQILKTLISQTPSRVEVRELDQRVVRLEHHLKLA